MAVSVADLSARLSLDLGDAEARLQAARRGFSDAEGGAKKFQGALGDLRQTAQRVFEVFLGVNLASLFEEGARAVKDFVVEASKLGREAKVQTDAFLAMAKAVGVHGDALIQGLVAASGETINASAAMRAAFRSLQEGMQPEHMIRLMEAARQLSKVAGTDVVEAFNDLTTAITNQQVRMLKQRGVVIDLQQAMEDYAKANNTTVDALTETGRMYAILEAVLRRVKEPMAALVKVDAELNEMLQRNAARWDETKEAVGALENRFLVGLLPAISGISRALYEQAEAAGKNGDVWETLGKKIGGFVTLMSLVPGQFAIGIQAMTSYFIRPITIIGSLIDDLANRRFPSLDKAIKAGAAASAEYDLKVSQGLEAQGKFVATLDASTNGLNRTSAATDKAGAATRDYGENALGALKNQFRTVTPDVDKLTAAMQGLAEQFVIAYLGPTTEAAKMIQMTSGLAKTLAETKGISDEAKASIMAWTNATAEATVAEGYFAENAKLAGEALDNSTPRDDRLEPWRAYAAAISQARAESEAYAGAQSSTAAELDATKRAITELVAAARSAEDPFAALIALGADEFFRGLTEKAQGLSEALEEEKRQAEVALSVQKAWNETVESAEDPIAVYVAALHQAGLAAKALGLEHGTVSEKLAAAQAALQALIRQGWDPESEAVRQVTADIKAFKAEAFEDDLRAIGVQAQLLGSDFDPAAAALEKIKTRMLEVAEAEGVTSEATQALKAEFDRLSEFEKTKAVLTDVFSSVQGAIEKLVTGVIQGTQTMAEAFKNLGQAIVIEFVNRVIKQALNPLMQAMATVIAGALTGVGTGGGWVLGGAGTAGAATGAAGGGTLGGGTGGISLGDILGTVGTIAKSALSEYLPSVTDWIGSSLGGVLGAGGGLGTAAGEGLGSLIDMSGAIWDITEVAGGATSSLGNLSGALSGLSGTLSGIVGAIGAVYGAYSLISGMVSGDISPLSGALTGAGIGIGATAAIGALAGIEFGPVGLIVGALIGAAAGAIMGWLGGKQYYAEARAKALEEANKALADMSAGFAAAAVGSAEDVLSALSETYAERGAVRTELRMPADLAAQIGATGVDIGDGKVLIQWAELTVDQFRQLLDIFRTVPELIGQVIAGSGDVGYLNQEQATQAQAAAKAAGEALLNTFIAFDNAREALNKEIPKLETGIRQALPGDLAQAFIDSTVRPLHAAMLAALTSGMSQADLESAFAGFDETIKALVETVTAAADVLQSMQATAQAAGALLPPDLITQLTDQFFDPLREEVASLLAAGGDPEEIQARLAEIKAETAALASLVTMYGVVSTEIIGLSRNLSEGVRLSIQAYNAQLQSMNEAVTQAQTTLATAAGDRRLSIEEEMTLVAALHDAIMARYQFEVQAVQAIEESLANILGGAGTALVSLETSLADFMLRTKGTTAGFDALLGRLADMADNALSASVQVWALGQAIQVLIARVTSAVQAGEKGLGPYPVVGTPGETAGNLAPPVIDVETMGRIAFDMTEAARPFIERFGELIAESMDRGDLEGALALLQQQAAAVNALGMATIQAVNDWADAAVAAVQAWEKEATKAVNDYYDDVIDGLKQQIADTKIARDVVEKEGRARIQALRDDREALQEASKLRIDTLNEEKASLQAELQLAEDLSQAVGAIQTQVDELLLGSTSALDAATQFQVAQEQYATALEAVRAAPTAETAGAFQTAADRLLTAAQAGMPRAGGQYQELFQGVVQDLQEVQRTLGDLMPGTPEDLAGAIGDVEDAIDREQAALVTNLAAIDASIKAEEASLTAALADFDTTIEALNAEVTAADATRNAALATIAQRAQEQIAAINAAREAQVLAVQQAVAAFLQANATQQASILDRVVGARLDELANITGGLSAQGYLALKARETVDALRAIQDDLEAYLRTIPGVELPEHTRTVELPELGSPENPYPVTPAPAGLGSRHLVEPFEIPKLPETPTGPIQYLDRGGLVEQTGIAVVHEGERVVPAGAGAGLSITINVQIDGSKDPEDLWEDLEDKVVHSLRWGKASRVLAQP